ncbi:hypothetical protein WJX73_009875 [Symbiochloris irregularis]|uniref:Uncharacterized protein n=1 Tax=Symbiochloris irregularis TaxID=706552 RepID=A0AAW1PWH4_9CHLO
MQKDLLVCEEVIEVFARGSRRPTVSRCTVAPRAQAAVESRRTAVTWLAGAGVLFFGAKSARADLGGQGGDLSGNPNGAEIAKTDTQKDADARQVRLNEERPDDVQYQSGVMNQNNNKQELGKELLKSND